MCMKYFAFPKRIPQSPVIKTLFINLVWFFPFREEINELSVSNGDSICYDKLSSLNSDNILLMSHPVSFNLALVLLLLMLDLHVFVF